MNNEKKVILIGAGIMSATLATILKELVPNWNITIFETLSNSGEESSNEWNNAGTGHAALCELNYTVEKPDGEIDITKAIRINEQFQESIQLWTYLVNQNIIQQPEEFIRSVPHLSFVQGEKNLSFLKKRFESLVQHPLFKEMEYTDDVQKLKEWIPLMMESRSTSESLAATKVNDGTDVNFGALTRKLMNHLNQQGVKVRYEFQVEDIKRVEDGLWKLQVWNKKNGAIERHEADFVFIGAGGGSLPLLQKTNIPESKLIGGFPVSGLFMVCKNPEVVQQHHAKVYGKAKVGAPPMSVPHLDTRVINDEKMLFFGPYAGFTPKFLKNGSLFDLIGSIKLNNIITMLAAGTKNIPLTKYLIGQVLSTKEKRMQELREFVPTAKEEDWEIIIAGQRVQVIKDTESGKGILQFGTEIIHNKDGSIAALLGASPGASTAVHVMLEVIQKCFPQYIEEWEEKIKEMIPSYGRTLSENPDLIQQIQQSTKQILKL